LLDTEPGYVLRKKENEELGKKVTKDLRPGKKRYLGTIRNGRARGLRKCGVKPWDIELKLLSVFVRKSIAQIIRQKHCI